MSMIGNTTGKVYAPGYFLAYDDETVTRVTRTIPANHAQVATAANGGKYVPAGAVYPSNDGNAIGLLYEDVDVTNGAAMGSVVTKGVVYTPRLPAAAESAAVTALTGITFIASEPSVVRPLFEGDMVDLTVASAAGASAGKTAITVTGYTKKSSESYVYKVGDTAAAVAYGDDLTSWSTWDGSADITAATNKKIVIAVVNAVHQAVAAGSATVTAHA